MIMMHLYCPLFKNFQVLYNYTFEAGKYYYSYFSVEESEIFSLKTVMESQIGLPAQTVS